MKTMEDIGFADALNDREDEFPLLARATKDHHPAIQTKVEWLYDDENGDRRLGENYTQIVRHPFSPDDKETQQRMLTEHLSVVESVLWDGRPSFDLDARHPRTTCGGVRHLLGREPNGEDLIALRPLRDLTLRHFGIFSRIAENTQGEWLSEFSLMVVSRQPLAVRYPA